MSPEALVLGHSNVFYHFGLAGQAERSVWLMWRERSPCPIAPVRVRNGLFRSAFNLNGAGAAGANAHTVNVVGSRAIEVNAVFHQNLT